MTTSENRDLLFISKLIELTQNSKLSWHQAPPREGSDTGIGTYVATLDGRDLRLYKTEQRFIKNNHSSFTLNLKGLGIPDEMVVPARAKLELLGEYGAALYVFEDLAGLNDLYREVSIFGSGARDLIDKVINSD